MAPSSLSANELNTGRVTVRLGAVADNYRLLRKRSAQQCAGVVKANAYGLGLEPIAHTLLRAGCDTFCVATLEEGLALREVAATPRILLLGGVEAANAHHAAAAQLEPVINSALAAQAWQPYRTQPATLHVDTGMHRLGMPPAEVAQVDWAGYKLTTLMTHLACADDPEHSANAAQLQRFDSICATLRATLPELTTSIANSAGCFLAPAYHGDLTRPGIGLYGGHPRNGVQDNPMTCAVSVEGRVMQLRTLPADTQLGYGGTYQAPTERTIAVVGMGYADGIPRLISNRGEAVINAARVPIVGRVSMDLVQLDVTQLQHSKSQAVSVGDWAEFFGPALGVDEVAQWAETIALEVLCGLGRRAHWAYID